MLKSAKADLSAPEPGIHNRCISNCAPGIWIPDSRSAASGMTQKQFQRRAYPFTSFSQSSSLRIAIFSSRALSSLDPAPGPATT